RPRTSHRPVRWSRGFVDDLRHPGNPLLTRPQQGYEGAMKKRIIILGAVVLLVVLGWTGAWFFIAGQLRQQIQALALAEGESAPQLVCGQLDIGGFPFRMDVECAGATLVSGDLLAEIPYMRVSAMVYRPTHLLGAVRGPVAIADAFTGARQQLDWSR